MTFTGPWLRFLLIPLLAVVVAGCGSGSSSNPSEPPPVDGPPSSGLTDVNLADYSASGSVGVSGVRVELPDGMAVVFTAGSAPASSGVGVRLSTSSPAVEDGATPVSAWYDVGVTVADVSAQPAAPIVLEIPATPPLEAVGHPGLQLWLVPEGDDPIPVRGVYNPSFASFKVVLLALPPRATFAVVYNPSIVRLDGSEVPEESLSSALVEQAAVAGWTTTDWAIDYDGRVITAAQAGNVIAAARKASRAYSAAAFREPVLVRDGDATGPRWHIHLISAKGSHFAGDTQTVGGVQQRIGSLYVDVACIPNRVGPKADSMQAQVAHELFHAIFYAYLIPFAPFSYQVGADTFAYRSTSGYNEGMATALGTYIEQDQAIPRPSQAPNRFEFPLGYFDENARGQAYRNQDFFVFLLRTGALGNFRRMVEALEASPAVAGLTRYPILGTYGKALEAADLGLAGATGSVGMTEFLAEYVANRGYVRSAEGHIWPGEPDGGDAGASYVLDRSLFDNVAYEVDDDTDCRHEGITAECGFTVDMDPMTGYLVDVDLNSLGRSWGFMPTSLQASASTTDGTVAFWMFGEKNDQGSADSFARSADGFGAELSGLGDAAPQVRMILARGGGQGRVAVSMVFTGGGDAGPECRILADCCPNLPAAIIGQCQEYVAKADETNCRVAQASMLRLCR